MLQTLSPLEACSNPALFLERRSWNMQHMKAFLWRIWLVLWYGYRWLVSTCQWVCQRGCAEFCTVYQVFHACVWLQEVPSSGHQSSWWHILDFWNGSHYRHSEPLVSAPEGSNIFQGGGGGGGSNFLFPIETHITCDFPGVVRTPCPLPPLGLHLLKMSTQYFQ